MEGRKENIGAAWEGVHVSLNSPAMAEGLPNQLKKALFRPCPGTPYPGHDLTAFPGAENVSHCEGLGGDNVLRLHLALKLLDYLLGLRGLPFSECVQHIIPYRIEDLRLPDRIVIPDS